MVQLNFFGSKNRGLLVIAAIVGITIAVSIVVIVWMIFSRKNVIREVNPVYEKYIEAYTSGVISKRGSIRIRLASDRAILPHAIDAEERTLFTFSPAVKGKTYWVDDRTIVFEPYKDLDPNKVYDVSFKLNKVIEVPPGLGEFAFQVQVIAPSFRLEYDGLKSAGSASLDRMNFAGTLFFSDTQEPAQIEQLLKAECDGKSLVIRWDHQTAENSSRFKIDSILLGKVEKDLILKWNGKVIGADIQGSHRVKVPELGSFKVLDIKAVQEPEQYVLVQFSCPLSSKQDLNGLITINDISNLRYIIDGSEVRIYAPDRLEGLYTASIHQGIENIVAKKFTKTNTSKVTFENHLPRVSIPGKGVILPSSNQLTLPFEAINLKAVDVTIVKIHESNVPQHLQVNDLNGEWELRRVAKPVVVKTIRLDTDPSLNLKRKNRFALDLDKLLRAEPGALYRVTIGFRKSYSLFKCQVGDDKENQYSSYQWGDKIDEDDEFWNRYNNYYPQDYDWNHKDDPCSNSYYTNEHWAVRNVLASNIGLIVKQGNDHSMVIAATDILTTKPLSEVTLKVLDYQQQVLQTVTTDQQGLAFLSLNRKPYLLLASKGGQRGYLKLDDGSSLPLSRFNVGGETIQKGIKGFLYADRGVWRPGDSIFVGFMMEKKAQKIPEDEPVVFELYTPQGQLNKRIVQNKLLYGVCTFRTATEAGAPTGNWQAKVKVGAALFQKTIKVETIMPNRLKINLDFGGKTKLLKGFFSGATLSAKWLFGASAQNLKAKIDASLTADQTSFKQYPGYSFDDPTNIFAAETMTIFDGPLDERGRASFGANLKPKMNAPGVLRTNLMTKVFEPGGNFSIDNFSIPYYMYNSYVGLRLPEGDKLSGMLLTDQNHTVNIVDVDPNGELMSGQRKIEVALYKIQWRWWWDQGEENLSHFTQDRHNQLLKKETITLQNGLGNWTLRINQPDWGRYLILVKDVQSGHVSGKTVYIDWSGWAQREQQNNPTDASMLSFASNKEKYKVGEEVILTIPSSGGGRALISIENGTRVLKSWWIQTEKGQTKYSFRAEEEMAPNVFANVILLQPHAQTANDLPIRMYGVIPILVENPKTVLKPTIAMPNILRPESATAITIGEAAGKAMTYHLALVDEGLLDLTRFKTPDPHASFYAREALGVKTWDLFDYVIGAWGGDLERILSIGGDASINRNVNPAKANRFKPIVKFMGPFHIGNGERKTHQMKLPPYIGSLRVMVIAGQDGAYGSAEKAVAVKKPLMLLATLPRMIGPNEHFKLPITVFATENNIKNVQVEVQASGLLSVKNASQMISFTQSGEKMIAADVQVKDGVGIAKVKIIARSGLEKAAYEVELDVRNPNPYITDVSGTELEKGKSWASTVVPIGTQGANLATIEVSSIPSLNLSKRLGYLVQYPHGCVEQITSAAFAQLMLPQLADLSEGRKTTIERNIKAGINRLKAFQTTDGGLAYWPGEQEADEWGTNYAGHFMLEAQARGYNLPVGFLEMWKRYQRNKATSWAPKSNHFYGADLSQAYRLYLLALAKSPEIGAMNRLKEFPYLSVVAKWRLAAAYQLIGQRAVAVGLVKGLSYQIKSYKELGGTFGSDLRDQAMILETLTELGNKTEASKLMHQLAARLADPQWYSTQTTAYTLISIAKYLGQNKSGAKMNYIYTLNGLKKSVSASATMNQIAINSNAQSTFAITNLGEGRLYVRVIRQGQAPMGVNPPIVNDSDILTMSIIYKTLKGKIINPDKLAQGTDFVAEVTLMNPGKRSDYEQMALTQIFPSGWEIINTRLSDQENQLISAPYAYKDIRDDRVLTYFNLPKYKTYTYQVLLNASYVGRYYLPSVACEAMYDQGIQARLPGKWIEVVE